MSQLTHAVRRSRRRARLAACALLLALAAFALVLIGRASADEGKPSDDAPAAVSNVAVGRADAVDAAAVTCTTSGVFATMPGMSETFSFGGAASRPVLVLFQGRWENGVEGDAVIQLTVDGVVQPGPGSAVRVHEDDASVDVETNGFNFISASLAPGTHTAAIRWLTIDGRICVGPRSLIVLHK
jgi:hypothetical protein